MTTIYLVRHAEAEGNLYRIAHGHYNSCITDDRGCRQIRALAERFRDVPVDAVYASDLIRTRTTAQSIYLPKGLQLHPDPAFREICMGEWEEHCWYELLRKYPQSHHDFNHRLDRWQVPGSETARQVLDRYLPALRRVARQHDGQTVAIFSHGAAMRIVLGTLQGLSLLEIGDTPFGDNTSVARLEVEGDDIRVLYRDDNSHLLQAGLSTLAKQKWWRQKGVQEMGQLYAPLTEEERQQLGVPSGGEGVAVRFVDELIGACPARRRAWGRSAGTACCPSGRAGIRASSPWDRSSSAAATWACCACACGAAMTGSGASGRSWAFPRWGATLWRRTSRHGCWTPISPCEGRKGEGDPCVARNFCQ